MSRIWPTKVAEIRRRADEIRELIVSGDDPEEAHGREDGLARTVLGLVADGHPDGRDMARIVTDLMATPGERWTA